MKWMRENVWKLTSVNTVLMQCETNDDNDE